DIGRELLPEEFDIANVVDAFIEAARELWGDGLDWNAFIGNGGENEEKLRRGLRQVRLIHRDFRHEAAGSLPVGDFAIDVSGIANCGEVFAGGVQGLLIGDIERVLKTGNLDPPDQLGMPPQEPLRNARGWSSADGV